MASDPRADRLRQLRIDRDSDTGRSPWMRRAAIVAVIVVVLGAAAVWLVGRGGAPRVELAAPEPAGSAAGGAASVLDAAGYVTARREATVSSKITGKVVEIHVEEGMKVAAGQLLARLDDAIPRRALALAEANLAAARSAAREIEVRLAEAGRNFDRARNLLDKGVASQAEFDAALAERDSLSARLDVSRDQVVVAERELDLRRQDLEDTRIRAPFDGVAISKDAQPGEMISPVSAGGGFTRTGVCTIVDMGSLEIEVDVNEAFLDRVEPHQAVVATLDAYPDWKIPAHVITTIPAADRQKATVRVRIAFDEPGDPRVLPDMGVKVSFRGKEPETTPAAAERPALTVPAAAVVRDGDRDVVFVYRDDVVERRAVAIGATRDGRTVVLSGLRQDERVVAAPPPGLADGDRVRVH